MRLATLGLFIPAAFVGLGIWLYRDPSKVVPSWGVFNPKNLSVQKVGRLCATFFMFCGMLMFMDIVGWKVLGSFAFLAGIGLAGIGTWFLRRWIGNSKTESIAVPVVEQQSAAEQKLLSRHWKRNLVIIGFVAIIIAVFVFALAGDSDVSKLAVAAAESNPALKKQLGEPMKKGLFTSGNIETDGSSGHADLAIPIRGPAGKATLYAVASKSAGLWKLDRLEAEVDGQAGRLNLLEAAAKPSGQ